MDRRTSLVIAASPLGVAGIAVGQGMFADAAADKVIDKYRTATCERPWLQRSAPKAPGQQKAVQFLKNDVQARTVLLNRAAGPIANRMFECGMIP